MLAGRGWGGRVKAVGAGRLTLFLCSRVGDLFFVALFI